VATPKQIRELMNVDGLTNDEVKSHLQVRSCLEKKKEWIFFNFLQVISHQSSVASVLTSPFILNILGGPSEVSSPHSASELGGGGGPERRHQRRCAAGRTAVRRGGGHLGATAGVRCGSRSAAAAGARAPSRRRVGNDDNSRRQGVRAGGDDVDARTATATASGSGEAVEQLLRRAAQWGRLLWLAGRVIVVVADRLCLMKRRRSVPSLASNFSCLRPEVQTVRRTHVDMLA
jgi:hypothetical protein